MSMFDNIVFDEFTLLEGEQAEAYKKRKAKEAAAQNKKEMDRSFRYTSARIAQHGEEDFDKHGETAVKKIMKSSPKTKKEIEDSGDNPNAAIGKKVVAGMDAMDRHGRRHPSKKQKVAESMIAAYESDYAY